MFTAAVIQAFEASNEGELLEPADLEHFVSVWSDFDPEATWFINASDVQSFLSRLRPPLGMAGQGRAEKGELYPKDPCLLEIAVNDKKQVNIVNIASLLAKRLAKEVREFSSVRNYFSLTTTRPKCTTDSFVFLSNTQQKQGDQFGELSNDHPTQKRATRHIVGMSNTLGDMYMKEAGVIVRAVIQFKKRKEKEKIDEAN